MLHVGSVEGSGSAARLLIAVHEAAQGQLRELSGERGTRVVIPPHHVVVQTQRGGGGRRRHERAQVRAGLGRLREARRGDVVADLLETGTVGAVLERTHDLTLDGDVLRDAALAQAAADLQEWLSSGIGVTSILSEDYPHRLRDIHEAPPLLFYRGLLFPHDQAVSVVGSRKASPRGISLAKEVAREVTSRGLSVSAGLAEGIDTAWSWGNSNPR